MNVLLTNDDGIYAVGLRAVYTALSEAGHNVYVVAPMTEQSAVGHSLTIFQALRVKDIVEGGFNGLGVHGTPSDCVKLALTTLLHQKIDLVISGINAGPNVGPDILYSGTLAAATEGAHAGLRSVALSYDNYAPTHLLEQARHAVRLVQNLPWESIPSRCVVNVNYPHVAMDECLGVCACPQTSALWHDHYEERLDPRGNRYWWLKGEMPNEFVEDGTDRDMLTKGYVTVTPLYFDFTHRECLNAIKVGLNS